MECRNPNTFGFRTDGFGSGANLVRTIKMSENLTDCSDSTVTVWFPSSSNLRHFCLSKIRAQRGVWNSHKNSNFRHLLYVGFMYVLGICSKTIFPKKQLLFLCCQPCQSKLLRVWFAWNSNKCSYFRHYTKVSQVQAQFLVFRHILKNQIFWKPNS